MSNTIRLLRIGVVALFTITLLAAADPSDGENPAALLERLRAKDNAFDNAILRYTTFGEHVVDFPWWKYPPRTDEERESMKRGPAHIKFRFHEQMVVRGRDTTFTREADPATKNKDGDWSMAPYQKWGEVDGVVREIIERGGSGPSDRTFEIRKDDASAWIVSEQRMHIEFVHGFGFGKRIKTISSMARAGNVTVLEGTILLFSEDISTFRIELGDDLLVKKATINVDAGGNLTRYEITTDGESERRGFVFAATGHYKRLALGLKNAQKEFGGPKVTDEFSSQFNDARLPLLDVEYRHRTMMEITPGTQVRDYLANRVYRLELDGAITELGPAVAKKQ